MRIEARSTVAGAAWPDCESEARRVHSSYLRFPADVPSGGRRVVLRLRVDHGRRAATNEVATAQSRVIGLRDQEPRLRALGSGGGGAASPRDAEDLARRAFRDEAADPARCQCAGDHGRHKPGPAARVAGTTAWLPPAASPIPDIIPNGTRATQDSELSTHPAPHQRPLRRVCCAGTTSTFYATHPPALRNEAPGRRNVRHRRRPAAHLPLTTRGRIPGS